MSWLKRIFHLPSTEQVIRRRLIKAWNTPYHYNDYDYLFDYDYKGEYASIHAHNDQHYGTQVNWYGRHTVWTLDKTAYDSDEAKAGAVVEAFKAVSTWVQEDERILGGLGLSLHDRIVRSSIISEQRHWLLPCGSGVCMRLWPEYSLDRHEALAYMTVYRERSLHCDGVSTFCVRSPKSMADALAHLPSAKCMIMSEDGLTIGELMERVSRRVREYMITGGTSC